MMKKSFALITLVAAFGILCILPANAQQKKEVYKNIHIPEKDPIPYPYVREADVMWETTVWRMVNLREKMNHPIYFPTRKIGDRMSLFDLFILHINIPDLVVYDPDTEYEFEKVMTMEEVYQKLNADTIREPIYDPQTGTDSMVVTGIDLHSNQISRLLVKEKWYFDDKHSSLQNRIIGICPIRVFPRIDDNTGEPTGEILQQKIFWVYYPDARPFLTRQPVFNQNNDAQRISFDDLFMQRRFSGYIYQQSNVYNNRRIESYARGMDAMFEAEEVKQWIFEFEHDLWEY